MSKKLKHWLICLTIAGASAFAVTSLDHFGQVHQLHLKTLDAHFIFRGKATTSNILLILMDGKTETKFPELQLFWHDYYAQAIRAAAGAGAKTLALDVAFAVPVAKWEPELDQKIAAAVQETAEQMPVVCGYVPGIMTQRTDWPVPVNIIASALGLSAFTNLTVDSDDFIRKQELIEPYPEGTGPATAGAPPLPRSLSLRMAEKFLQADAVLDKGKLTLAGHDIPVDEARQITINYAGPPGTFPSVSLYDFLEAAKAGDQQKLRNWVNGKAVLIGPDSIYDRHATPFYTIFSGQRWNTPGVEIHANTLNTLLSRNYLLPVNPAARGFALFLMGLAVSAAVSFLGVRTAAGAVTGILAVMVAGTHLLFRSGWVLSTSELAMSMALAGLAMVVYRYATAEERKRLFHKALSLFVSRTVADDLDATPEGWMSTKRLMVTIMFTDIRGFTSFCDEKDPEEVVHLLNEYMTGMTSIIVRHGGQVNKYIGDGILAIFCDDDKGSTPGDHPRRAVLCAGDMVNAPGKFETGAGVHTGMAVVGCVGSVDKMEYTVLGDTVNVASRLESLNKEHKTKMLMSEVTHKLLGPGFQTVELGAVLVRGKATSSSLYTLVGMMRKVAYPETAQAKH